MRQFCIFLFFIISLSMPLTSESLLPLNIKTKHFENGLGLICMNRQNDLVFDVRFYFRCGAMAQTIETAGIFWPIGAMFVEKLEHLGIHESSWSVENEYVVLHVITKNEKALNTIASIASVCFDTDFTISSQTSLIVQSSIEKKNTSFYTQYKQALLVKLFGKYPYRKDTLGQSTLVPQFTQELYDSMRLYFVPSNCLIAVSGNIPSDIFTRVNEISNLYKPGETAFKKDPIAFPRPSVVRFQFLMAQDETIKKGTGKIGVYYRGPGINESPLYAGAGLLWQELTSLSSVPFRSHIYRDVPELVSLESTNFIFLPARDASLIGFETEFFVSDKNSAADRAQRWFKEQMKGVEISDFQTSTTYAPKATIDLIKQRYTNKIQLLSDSPDTFFPWYATYWSILDIEKTEVFLNSVLNVTMADIKVFVKEYIMRNLEVVTVRLNPLDFEKEKKIALTRYFELVTETTGNYIKK